MGDASPKEGDGVGRTEIERLMDSKGLFSLTIIKIVKRNLVLLVYFFHLGALRSTPGVTDWRCVTSGG